MKTVLIANTKGGCGKTTVATNLAGYLASIGNRVGMTDLDRQKSSTNWIKRRPKDQYPISAHASLEKTNALDWLIIDAPAGIRNDKLKDAVKLADCIIVPIQPSVFDSGATENFLEILSEEKAIRKEKTFVALVGMRVNARTNAANILNNFMDNTGFPILSNLRNAQVYVNAAEHGLSIFDMRPSLVKQDLDQWNSITQWVVSFNAK